MNFTEKNKKDVKDKKKSFKDKLYRRNTIQNLKKKKKKIRVHRAVTWTSDNELHFMQNTKNRPYTQT